MACGENQPVIQLGYSICLQLAGAQQGWGAALISELLLAVPEDCSEGCCGVVLQVQEEAAYYMLKGVGKAAKFFKNVGDVQCKEIMILVQNDVPLLALCLSLNTLP